jgi:hypothetical protein
MNILKRTFQGHTFFGFIAYGCEFEYFLIFSHHAAVLVSTLTIVSTFFIHTFHAGRRQLAQSRLLPIRFTNESLAKK